MTQSSSQAAQFYREVADNRKLYTIRDKDGYPAPKNSDGYRAQPFWSSRSRVEKVINNVDAYSRFEIVTLTWEVFTEKWVLGLTDDHILVGINWSGEIATGHDIQPKEVQSNVEANFAR